MAVMAALLPAHAGKGQDMSFPAVPGAQHGQENGSAPSGRSAPVSLMLTYGSDLNAVVAGGERRGAQYLGRIGLIADADLDRLLGWRGATAHISVQQIHGRGLSQQRVGNLLTVSGLEAEPALRLFNLWVQQPIGTRANLRVGQFTAGQEFAISDTAAFFVNSTFGWPGSFATDLPSGGPAYPLAAPGIRLAVAPGARTGLRLALFAGDPAGPGGGDPQRRDRHGLNGFRLAGAPFLIGEVQRSSGGVNPKVMIRAGGWFHFDRFADLRFDAAGRSLATAGVGAQALQHGGNAGVYAIVDFTLWQPRPGPGPKVRGFFRASFSPPDRNTIDLYADGGVAVTGALRGRPDDMIGLGLAIARISPALRALARDDQRLAGLAGVQPDFEAVVELSYQLRLGGNMSVQPNVQYVIHPGARLPSPGVGVATADALLVGLRTAARF